MRASGDWKLAPKVALTRLGGRVGQPFIYALNGAFNYLHVGWWLRAHGFLVSVRARTRDELFELAAAEVGDRDVLYLEFGVLNEGASMRRWSTLLLSPRSKLHGFDKFPRPAA